MSLSISADQPPGVDDFLSGGKGITPE